MRRIFPLVLLIAAALLVWGAHPARAQDYYANAVASDNGTDYAVRWMQLLYDRVERERRNVPQAARIYAYGSVALYEAVRGGFPDRPPLDLNDMPALPAPEAGVDYDWITVMNGAMRTLIPGIMAPLQNQGTADTMTNFNTAESNATVQAVRNLSNTQFRERAQIMRDRATLDRSLAHGTALAEAILAWAAEDGFAATREMTAAYLPPVGEGLWTATTAGQRAMEPYWGLLRPFALAEADSCAVPLDVPFDSDLDSTFHKQAMEVYDMHTLLTDEQRAIATFWDERVGESGTASGHWVYVANLLAGYLDMPLEQAAEMYALVGVGMADSFISAWSLKYQANLPRPETYIQTYLDPTW
jgi:hypothetical protein